MAFKRQTAGHKHRSLTALNHCNYTKRSINVTTKCGTCRLMRQTYGKSPTSWATPLLSRLRCENRERSSDTALAYTPAFVSPRPSGGLHPAVNEKPLKSHESADSTCITSRSLSANPETTRERTPQRRGPSCYALKKSERNFLWTFQVEAGRFAADQNETHARQKCVFCLHVKTVERAGDSSSSGPVRRRHVCDFSPLS